MFTHCGVEQWMLCLFGYSNARVISMYYWSTGTNAGINAGANSLMQFSMTLNKFDEINRGARITGGPK